MTKELYDEGYNAGYVAGLEAAKSGEAICWHCGVVLACKPIFRCEDCPDECDTEGCDELGCSPLPMVQQDEQESTKS